MSKKPNQMDHNSSPSSGQRADKTPGDRPHREKDETRTREHHRDGEGFDECLENAKRRLELGPDGLASKPLASIESFVDSEVGGNRPSGDPKTDNLRPIKSSGYKAKSTAPPSTSRKPCQPAPNQPRSPRRRRTENTAIEKLDRELNLSPEERGRAILRIRRSKQPNGEVRRIVESIGTGRFQTEEQGPVDFSDVQELLVRFIRRDGGIWPPQTLMLQKLDEAIATRGMTRRAFNAKAARILSLPQSLPRAFLDHERAYLAGEG